MNDINNFFSYKKASIAKAKNEDVFELAPMINEAYSYIEKYRGKPRTNAQDLLKRLAENDYYVIWNSNAIAGCFYLEELNDSIHFGMFALAPEYRGIGLGEKIIKAIEKYAKSKGIKTFEIDRMSASPWLKKYYEDKGFVETGVVEKWGQIDLIHMQKQI